MADKVISISEKSGNRKMQSPEAALNDALAMVGKHGAFEKGKKLLILCVDETDGSYGISFVQAGMKMSECTALCEIAKSIFLEEMGY